MSEPEFKHEMQRVITEYDPNGIKGSYGAGRVAMIFKIFERVSAKDFREVVDRLFESERMAPMAKEFKRAWSEITNERHLQAHRENTVRSIHREPERGLPPERIRELLPDFMKRKANDA